MGGGSFTLLFSSECLCELGWFTGAQVAAPSTGVALHQGFELRPHMVFVKDVTSFAKLGAASDRDLLSVASADIGFVDDGATLVLVTDHGALKPVNVVTLSAKAVVLLIVLKPIGVSSTI